MILSVVIPFHEDFFLLHRAIQSVTHQLNQHTELLLIGDGIDQSIGKTIQSLYPEARVYIIPKLGANSARMTGLNYGTGQYILFVDSDDVLPPKTLDYYTQVISQHGPDLIIGNVSRIRHEKKPIPFYHFNITQKVINKDELTVKQLYSFPVLICKCFKKELLLMGHVLDYSMYQDIAITALLFKNATNIYYSNTILYHYHSRKGSTSHEYSNTEESIVSVLPLIDNIYAYYNQYQLSTTEKRYLTFLTIRFYFTIIRRSFQFNTFAFSKKIQKKSLPILTQLDYTIVTLHSKAFVLHSILSSRVLFRIYFQFYRIKKFFLN